jgi:hypothetical protein
VLFRTGSRTVPTRVATRPAWDRNSPTSWPS